jgi:DNA-binding IclR family transcriptional regulator
MIAVAESIDADALRIRHMFLSEPAMRASADDIALLLDLSSRHARALLESLAHDGFLRQTTDGRYVRSHPEQARQPQP